MSLFGTSSRCLLHSQCRCLEWQSTVSVVMKMTEKHEIRSTHPNLALVTQCFTAVYWKSLSSCQLGPTGLDLQVHSSHVGGFSGDASMVHSSTPGLCWAAVWLPQLGSDQNLLFSIKRLTSGHNWVECQTNWGSLNLFCFRLKKTIMIIIVVIIIICQWVCVSLGFLVFLNIHQVWHKVPAEMHDSCWHVWDIIYI